MPTNDFTSQVSASPIVSAVGGSLFDRFVQVKETGYYRCYFRDNTNYVLLFLYAGTPYPYSLNTITKSDGTEAEAVVLQ